MQGNKTQCLAFFSVLPCFQTSEVTYPALIETNE